MNTGELDPSSVWPNKITDEFDQVSLTCLTRLLVTIRKDLPMSLDNNPNCALLLSLYWP